MVDLKRELLVKQDRIEKKINIYNRKKETMGLTEKEKELLLDLIIEKFKIIDLINDELYNEYIYGFIKDEVTDKVFEKLYKKIGWKGEVIIEIDDICNKIDALDKDELNKIYDIVKTLELELIYRVECYYYEEDNSEILDILGDIFSGGKNSDLSGIIDFIEYKFNLLYVCLDEVKR